MFPRMSEMKLKANIWQCKMPMKKLKWKLEFWKSCVLHRELDTFLYLITSDDINDDINKCDFLKYCGEMGQNLEDLPNSVNQYLLE